MNDRLHFFAPTQAEQPWRRSGSYPACTADACGQNSSRCPCPNECQIPEEDITGARPLVLYLIAALSSLGGLIARFWN